jgi:hypothetical protein
MMQEGKVVSYESRKLNTHEKKYLTSDLELLVIVRALRAWKLYLISNNFKS